MSHSFSQTTELDCPRCGTHFRAEIWLIVDAAERPDLLEKVRQGSLHQVTCPQCGHAFDADQPLLLYFPPLPLGEGPGVSVLFSPAQSTTSDQDQEHARALLARLKESLGPAWQDEWLPQGLPAVPRPLLPLALSEGLDAAQKALASQTQAPPAEAIRILEGAGELGKNLIAVLNVRLAEEHRAFLEQHPELYGEEGIALLQRLLTIETWPQAKQKLEMFLQIHRRCREDGLENTFAQIIQASQLPPDLRAILEELARSGVEIRSPEDLQRLLDSRPDLRQRLERLPPQPASDLHRRFQELLALQSKAENNPALWPQVLQGWQDLIARADQEGETLLAANARGNLANACVRLYEVTGDSSWANQAEKIFDQLGQIFSRRQAPQAWAMTQHSLGNLFLDRYERSGEEAHAQAAEEHYQNVLTLSKEVALPASYPFRAAGSLCRLHFRQQRWPQCLEAASAAFSHLEDLLSAGVTRGGKEDWLREARGLAAQTA